MAAEDEFAAFMGEVTALGEAGEEKGVPAPAKAVGGVKSPAKPALGAGTISKGPQPASAPHYGSAPAPPSAPRPFYVEPGVLSYPEHPGASTAPLSHDPVQNLVAADLSRLQQAQANAAAPAEVRNDKAAPSGKHFVRQAAGTKWVDPTLGEWPEDDFRLFAGDLGTEVNDELLTKAFKKYASFNKAKVIRDKRTHKSKGFGFVSFADGNDFARALREMNGKYIGTRPCKLKKSDWQQRNLERKGKAVTAVQGSAGVQKKKRHNKKHHITSLF